MQYIFWVANTPEPIYTGSTGRKSDKRVIWAFDVKLGYRAYQSSCALIITWRCTGNLNYHVCKCWLMSYAPKALTEFGRIELRRRPTVSSVGDTTDHMQSKDTIGICSKWLQMQDRVCKPLRHSYKARQTLRARTNVPMGLISFCLREWQLLKQGCRQGRGLGGLSPLLFEVHPV